MSIAEVRASRVEEARQAVAEAHKSMTPAEIAEHALQLAEAFALMTDGLQRMERMHNSACRAIEATTSALRRQQQSMRRVLTLQTQMRRREARELLRATAEVEIDIPSAPELKIICPDDVLHPLKGI